MLSALLALLIALTGGGPPVRPAGIAGGGPSAAVRVSQGGPAATTSRRATEDDADVGPYGIGGGGPS
jgi:hypothetical protein